ncbi:MAG TPA: arsenosugar biosynthesis radical SAM protein ArsS [Cellvibrionaceae bacterium]|nr:arsenosugar biosynthesis radical SAM protein ArsS [Cellvibrionaceae bacterium]HMW70654.1 arsenosugar biosynthesis radical SAM protein ArsS [Cellvibrionaceae bacterium]HMY38769.1 arsenosugar biosynthesis radical SAM protein ArsS [Marinagarivorans sp.]HNG58178.1 arsenosugar biosynthesis radical SAM protein ArsS [Cellvibrionaceae bacterium]
MRATLPLLNVHQFPAIHRQALNCLQVNLGYKCNQTCLHCHVNAGPTRKEMMTADNLALIPQVLAKRGIKLLDLTGGAPEMHEGFQELVRAARALGVQVIDRCNLTILQEPGFEAMAAFLAEQQVQVVASLPCYASTNVDKQRGAGVFAKSIAALQKLNRLGYGVPGSGLELNLVYNPQGPVLPPEQSKLQRAYQDRLKADFGVVFNQLFTITNMPIARFGSMLVSKGQFVEYMELLRANHAEANLAQVMCKSLVSVDWQGYLYDCDFNQQLGLVIPGQIASSRRHLRDLLEESLIGAPIRVADHCFGCTAGAGSSCQGALEPAEAQEEAAQALTA